MLKTHNPNNWSENIDAPNPEAATQQATYENLHQPATERHFRPAFNSREMEIILLSSHGYTSVEIAQRMYLAPDTIMAYRKIILKKTGCRNITQVVAQALRCKWIS